MITMWLPSQCRADLEHVRSLHEEHHRHEPERQQTVSNLQSWIADVAARARGSGHHEVDACDNSASDVGARPVLSSSSQWQRCHKPGELCELRRAVSPSGQAACSGFPECHALSIMPLACVEHHDCHLAALKEHEAWEQLLAATCHLMTS